MSTHNVYKELEEGDAAAVSATVVKVLNCETGCLLAYGNTVPGGVAGYAIGCIFIHTDGGAGTSLYCNEGTATTADFDAVTVA